jgi:hypothetical protein
LKLSEYPDGQLVIDRLAFSSPQRFWVNAPEKNSSVIGGVFCLVSIFGGHGSYRMLRTPSWRPVPEDTHAELWRSRSLPMMAMEIANSPFPFTFAGSFLIGNASFPHYKINFPHSK